MWQVKNGGLAQWVGNIRPGPAQFRDVANGLRLARAREHLAVFEGLEAHLLQDPERAREIAKSCGFSDLGDFSSVASLQDAFFKANGSSELELQIESRLRVTPSTRSVQAISHADELAVLCLKNSKREERRLASPGGKWPAIKSYAQSGAAISLCRRAGMKLVSVASWVLDDRFRGQEARTYYLETDNLGVIVVFLRLAALGPWVLSKAHLLSLPGRQMLGSSYFMDPKD